jgi:hypothetical protein
MSALMSGAWESQIRFPTWQQFQSRKAKAGIWSSRPPKFRLTSDRQLQRQMEGQSDAFGNILRSDAQVMAKVMVERHLMTLTGEQRATITPGDKWEMVDRATLWLSKGR